ncbi:TonB-dependent receptor plug domain-containing protein [Roseomonas sp. BN140053]|uniref:TonB-dependent receptor plug domain-containing protein n=1 Tax=Roseomonas sp. BN140053 TaxID=3391898 RepID=UPI0039E75B4D
MLAAACCLAWAPSLRAQSIDYGDMEQLFGEPVTTSATGKPQRASQVPANVDIITAEQIRRSGYDNLPDILSLVPGMDVRRTGFAAADVSVRGYNRPSNPRLLVLVNGQQVYIDLYGATQWYALPVELGEIRQIEVIKGPNSALFGFNAASGVINIVTDDPLRDSVNGATLRGGTQEYGALSAFATAKLNERVGVRLSAGGFRADDFEPRGLDPATLVARVRPRRESLAGDARFNLTPGVEAVLSGSVVDLRTFEPVASPYYAASRYRTNAIRGALSAESAIGLLGFNVYRNAARYDYRSGLADARLDNTVTVVQASDTVKLGADHTLRLQLEYRDNDMAEPAYGNRFGYRLYAGGLMWNWQFAPNLSLTNAVRLDHVVLDRADLPVTGGSGGGGNGRTITGVSFNSGVVWHATDADTLRLTLGRGLEAPSLFALGTRQAVPATGQLPAIRLVGSTRLSPSAVTHGELGYDHRLSALASTLRAAVFAQKTDDVIADPFSAGAALSRQGVLYRSTNVGDSSAVGGEIGLRGTAAGFRWDASYSYISITDDLDRSSRLSFENGTPTHVVRLGGGYTLDRLEFDAQARWQSRYRDVTVDARTTQRRPVEVSNYLQLDARLGYRLTDNVEVSLTGQQINASRQLQAAGPPVERRVFLTLSTRF